jgi:hypothetical protein
LAAPHLFDARAVGFVEDIQHAGQFGQLCGLRTEQVDFSAPR